MNTPATPSLIPKLLAKEGGVKVSISVGFLLAVAYGAFQLGASHTKCDPERLKEAEGKLEALQEQLRTSRTNQEMGSQSRARIEGRMDRLTSQLEVLSSHVKECKK